MPCLFCGNLEAPGIFKPHLPCQLSNGEPCESCKEIQELEPQIAGAKDALLKMLIRHRELRKQMNRSHNRIIQQLPPEIVSHIFELSIPYRPLEESSRGLSKNERRAPLIIGSVCQVWRQIAFSTPQIWTTISIHLGNRFQSPKVLPTISELAQEWLSRSGELPLSIYIYGNEDTDDSSNIGPLIDVVNRHSSRWKHLELELPYHLASHFCGNSSGTSILHSLRLFCEDDSEYRTLDKTGSLTLNNVIPSPTIISLHDWPWKRVGIEWNNATHVKLGWPDITECIEVLRRAPQLMCFTFTDTNDRQSYLDFVPYAIPTEPIVRPLLRELYISIKHTDQGAKFLDSFTLPGLEILAFSDSWSGNSIPTNNLISLLNRSSCPLNTLSLENVSINRAEVYPLLQATPSVRKLKFSQLSDIALFNIIETLTLMSGDNCEEDGHILPALELLSVSHHDEHQSEERFPWSLVAKIFGPLAEIHSPHRRPLRKFDISFNRYKELDPFHYIDEESAQRFLELREAGITLNFRIFQYRTAELDLLELSIKHHRNQK